MVQVLAVVVVVVLVKVEVKADVASASVLSLYVVSVLTLLLGKLRPRADAVLLYKEMVRFLYMSMMIPAFGEI